MESTVWQRALAQALHLPTPRPAHLPLVVAADGQKLSKSRSAAAIAEQAPSTVLVDTLALLQQSPPAALYKAKPVEILDWGAAHWQPERLHGLKLLQERDPAQTAGPLVD